MTDGALLVYKRRRHGQISPLGMQCDSKEIPSPLDDDKPVGWWLAEVSSFSGKAASKVDDGQLTKLQETRCAGTAALAVTSERMLGILSPSEVSTPAVWWSWSLPSIEVETDGELGLFKKRPRVLVLTCESRTVELASVSRLYRNSGRYQTGQENSLLSALS
jgi:hypothetical protein